MKELVEAIRKQGRGIGSDIVKVDMFLNHRVDSGLAMRMGDEFRRAFEDTKPDLILTVEASGIAAALATALAFGNLPMVFAKKSATRNVTDEVYQSRVYSFTHARENYIRVVKTYLPKGSRVLIIDDFLANGEASEGLCDLVRQAGCEVAGIGVCVEKSFQPGRAKLEREGYRVVSLAKVHSIQDGFLSVTD